MNSFICQRCKRNLKIETEKPLQESSILAFQSTHPLLHDEESLSSSTQTQQQRHDQHVMDLLGESFVVLPANGTKPKLTSSNSKTQTANLDKQVATLTSLFELCSDRCSYDHPLCTSCSESIVQELDRRLQECERDRERYAQFLEKLQKEAQSQPPSNSNDPTSVTSIEAAEAALAQQLAAIKLERQGLQTELRALEDESKQLDAYEQRFWEEYQDFQVQMQTVTDEQNAVKQEIKVATECLERMKRTNVYDDAFHISYDGHFGTINGFRLGRLPSQQVDWSETNAGLGQVVLLLHTIARRHDAQFKFSKYKLIPMGSFSKMAKIDDPTTTYELYGSNDLSLGRLFWYRRFDTALVWLLACIKEFGDFAATQDTRFTQRYAIKNDSIGDVSIKLQFNNEARWTKALKYMLTNLKFLLVWASKRDSKIQS